MNLDFLKIDLNDIRIVRWLALAFVSIVLIVDLFLFSSLFSQIGLVRQKRDMDRAAVNFFNNLIIKKDKLATAQIFPQANIDDLLDKIQKIAERNNVEVNIGGSLETDKNDGTKNPYALKDFSLEASGDFMNVGIFLTAVKALPDAVIDLVSIHLTSDKADASMVRAKINFVLLATKDEED